MALGHDSFFLSPSPLFNFLCLSLGKTHCLLQRCLSPGGSVLLCVLEGGSLLFLWLGAKKHRG